MLDHAGFSVADYARSKAFYENALAPLGYSLIMEAQQDENDSPAAGFGANGKPDFWIGGEGGLNRHIHIAIVARDRAAVDAFYRAALAAGGKDNGAPGLRAALPCELLRSVRARSGRPQYRGGLPRAGVSSPAGAGPTVSVSACAGRGCAAAAH
jgi:hypothetical protein